MRRGMGRLLILIMALLMAGLAGAEELRAPDFVLEGYDGDGTNHDWESNLFFQRMQEETGIAFELRQRSNQEQWTERKKDIALGEDLPDVLFKAELTAAETLEMAKNGILLDLKPYLAEYAPDLWALLQEKPEYLRALTLPDGSIRTLPCVNELPANNLIWINQRWLDNLKLEMPSTAEELTAVLRAFRTEDPNRNGRADEVPLSALGMWDLRFLAHAFGLADNDYYLSLQEGQVKSALPTEENRAFLSWLHELWAEGLLSHQSFSTADALRQVTDEKAPMIYGVFLSNSPLTVVPAAALDQYTALTPLAYGGKRIYRDLAGTLTRGTFAVTKACSAPEKVIAWVNRLYTQEGSRLLQAGREGEEYSWNEEGNWEWIADLQTVANEVLPNATLADGGVAPGIVTADFQAKYADRATQRIVADMQRVQDCAVLPMPVVYLTEEDAAEVARLQERIAPFAEKRMAEFVTGDVPLNDGTWEEFKAGLAERGLEKMAALWQKYAGE